MASRNTHGQQTHQHLDSHISRPRTSIIPSSFCIEATKATGLLCHLLGIKALPQLLTHPMLGAVFENLIVAETAKHHLNGGVEPELYFYGDTTKREVDLLDLTDSEHPLMAEIKSSQTYYGKYGATLTQIGEALGIPAKNRAVIYRGEGGISTKQFKVLNGSTYLEFSGK